METDPRQEQLQVHPHLQPDNQRQDQREQHLHDLLFLHQQQQLHQQSPGDADTLPPFHLPSHLSSPCDMSYLTSHPSACSFQDYLDPDSDPDADAHFPSVSLSFGSSSPSDNDAASNGRGSSAEDGSADENSVHVRGIFADSSVIEHFVASSEQQDMG